EREPEGRRDGARLDGRGAGMPDRGAVSRAEPDPAGAPGALPPRVSPSSDVAVACEGVSLAYGARTVLHDVTFAVRRRAADRALAPRLPGERARRRAHGRRLAASVVAPAGARRSRRGPRGAR